MVNETADMRYNHVYELLVKDELDIFGQLAYAVYKQQKATEVKRFLEENSRQPTKEDLSPFVRFATSEDQLRLYRKQAESLASYFVDNALNEQLEEEKIRLEEEKNNEIKDIIRQIQPHNYWYGVGQSILASILVLLGGVAFLFGIGGFGYVGKMLIELSSK